MGWMERGWKEGSTAHLRRNAQHHIVGALCERKLSGYKASSARQSNALSRLRTRLNAFFGGEGGLHRSHILNSAETAVSHPYWVTQSFLCCSATQRSALSRQVLVITEVIGVTPVFVFSSGCLMRLGDATQQSQIMMLMSFVAFLSDNNLPKHIHADLGSGGQSRR